MVINAGELPIYLRIGTTDELEIGHVEVPLTSGVKDGVWTVSVDMSELKRRLASMLREAADVAAISARRGADVRPHRM